MKVPDLLEIAVEKKEHQEKNTIKTASGWNEETAEKKENHLEKNAKKTAGAGTIKK